MVFNHDKRCMKKNNLSRALVLCILMSITVSGCDKNVSSPSEMNQNIPAQLETVEDVDIEQVDAAEYAKESSSTESSDTKVQEIKSSDESAAVKESLGEVVQKSTQNKNQNNMS